MSLNSLVNIAGGAGFSNDRRDLGVNAARALMLSDAPRSLIYECLAERTLTLAVSFNRLSVAQISSLRAASQTHHWSLARRFMN